MAADADAGSGGSDIGVPAPNERHQIPLRAYYRPNIDGTSFFRGYTQSLSFLQFAPFRCRLRSLSLQFFLLLSPPTPLSLSFFLCVLNVCRRRSLSFRCEFGRVPRGGLSCGRNMSLVALAAEAAAAVAATIRIKTWPLPRN